MPPQIALLLCTGFVIAALRWERQNATAITTAIWIPCLWLMANSSKSLTVWFGVGASSDAESGSPLDRTFLMSLALAGVIVLARRKYQWSSILRQHGWLLLLLLYMCVSSLWSDITGISLRRWVREVLVVIMASLILSEPKPREALESLLRRSAYVLITFSLLLVKYYPALGREYGRWSGQEMWIGVTVQKNTLGRLCLVSVFFLLWSLYCNVGKTLTPRQRRVRWADVAVLFMSLYLLKGAENAYSATSIATLAVGIAGFVGLRSFRRVGLPVPQAGVLACVVLLMCIGIAAPFVGGTNIAIFSSTLGRDATLTGRTDVWALLVPVVESQPFFGVGFGSFWTTARREFYDMSHGHNGYLDVLLELGAVGLLLYTAVLLACARRLHGILHRDFNWGCLGVCVLLMGVVYNATESALSSLAHELTALTVLFAFAAHAYDARVPRVGVLVRAKRKRVLGTASVHRVVPRDIPNRAGRRAEA